MFNYDDYFKKLEGNELPPEETKEEDEGRGILTDVPVQAVGGVADAGKSALRLIEGVGQDAKRKFNQEYNTQWFNIVQMFNCIITSLNCYLWWRNWCNSCYSYVNFGWYD